METQSDRLIVQQLMTPEEFEQFFAPYSEKVEGFYEAAYWRLSDSIIQALIKKHIRVDASGTLLDAGGGTGRWSVWCHRELHCKVTLADKSRAMLDAAAAARAEAGLEDEIELIQCDLEQDPLPASSFDGAIATYGVLSFLNDPVAAVRNVQQSLKPGASALLMGHGHANALMERLPHADRAELAALARDHIVKWSPESPPLRVFSSEDLRELLTAAGFVVDAIYGVTSIAMPGPEDFTYPYERMSEMSEALEDEAFFDLARELELAHCGLPGWADRGVNLVAVGTRPSG